MQTPEIEIGGLVAGLAVALLAGVVARGGVIGEDASLAAFYLISLALGVLLISLKGSQVDLFHVLFGSVLALDDATLMLTGSASKAGSIGWSRPPGLPATASSRPPT